MVTHWIETNIRQSVKTTRHAIHRCVSKQTPCLARLYAVWHFVCGAVVKQRKIDQVQGNAKELRLALVYCTTWVDFALHCSMVFPRVDRSGSGSMRRWMAATWHWHLVTEVTEQRTEVAASLRFVTSVLILGPKWPKTEVDVDPLILHRRVMIVWWFHLLLFCIAGLQLLLPLHVSNKRALRTCHGVVYDRLQSHDTQLFEIWPLRDSRLCRSIQRFTRRPKSVKCQLTPCVMLGIVVFRAFLSLPGFSDWNWLLVIVRVLLFPIKFTLNFHADNRLR